METARDTDESQELRRSSVYSSENLDYASIYQGLALSEDVASEKEPTTFVRPVKYINLERHNTLVKAGLIKPQKKESNVKATQQEHQRTLTFDECQQDQSSVLLPSFQETKAYLFKHQLLNNKTELKQVLSTFKDAKGIRHNKKLSPLASKELSTFMQQSHKTNLMWTTTQYSANNTHTSLKTTKQETESTKLGVFPSQNRSQSIQPSPARLLNEQSKDLQIKTPFQLKLSQTQSTAFYKPKASIEKYQQVFTRSNLQGFETQRNIKRKQILEDVHVPPPVFVNPVQVPESLRKTIIAGHKPPKQTLIPACFCVKDELCLNHTDQYPHIDLMVDLIESQIETLQLDDVAMDNNLEMISKTSEKLLTSRKDTFKEVLMDEYRNRQGELTALETQVAHMSLQEHQHVQIVKERDFYAKQLREALVVMDKFENEVSLRTQQSKEQIEKLTSKDISTQIELSHLKTELERVQKVSKFRQISLEITTEKLKEATKHMASLDRESGRMAIENENLRKFFVLNNAMLVTHKDDPAFIRQQIDEVFQDFGKAVSQSGSHIEHAFDSIAQLVNDRMQNKNPVLDRLLQEIDDEDGKQLDQ